MLICIEGIDFTGKSTLANNLQKLLWEKYPKKAFTRVHYPNIKSTEVKEYSKQLYRDMFRMHLFGINMICDRSHLGEYVYAQKYRDYDPSYIFDLEIEYGIHDDEFLILLYTTDIDALLSRDDGLSISNMYDDIREETDLFAEAFIYSNMKNKFSLDIHGLSREDIAKQVFNFIDLKKENNGNSRNDTK